MDLKNQAESYLSELKVKFKKDSNDWNSFAKEVPEKFTRLLREGMKPSISRGDRTPGTLSINLSFNADTKNAEKYLETVKEDIDKKNENFDQTLIKFNKELQKYYDAGLEMNCLVGLIRHFDEWVTFTQNLTITIMSRELKLVLPDEHVKANQKWKKIANKWEDENEAAGYGISVENLTKHKKYLELKRKKEEAKKAAELKDVAKKLETLKYLDSADLAATAKNIAADLQKKEEEEERQRRAEEERKKQAAIEEERLRKEQEAIKKAEAAKKAKEMRGRYVHAAGLIACCSNHCVAVRPDGTVIATGKNNDGQCNVSGWRDIVAVACEYYGTVGLTKDGRVRYTGSTLYRINQCTSWRNIKAIAISDHCVFGLRNDGTVVATADGRNGVAFSTAGDVTTWRNIQSICAGEGYIAGIDTDGNIRAISRNYLCRCEPSNYLSGHKDIVEACFGYLGCGIMLKKDGSCKTEGPQFSYIATPTEINKHHGIVKVHLLGGRPVAILADGRLIAENLNRNKSEKDKFNKFLAHNKLNRNVVAISGDHNACAILTVDGRIHVYTADDSWIYGIKTGQCFGNDFRLFENFHEEMDRLDRVKEEKERAYREAEEEKERAHREAVVKRAEYRKQGVCQHCGGAFKKGLIGGIKCSSCGKKKDYV